MTLTDGQKTALAVLVAVAVAGAGYVVFTGSSDAGVSCYATGQAVGIVAAGLAENKGASAIIAAAGFGFLSTKCEDWVKSLVDDPTKETELTVDSPEKPTTTVTADTLFPTEPPATPTPAAAITLDRILACGRWNVQFMRDWCYDGTVGPPPENYSPQQTY